MRVFSALSVMGLNPIFNGLLLRKNGRLVLLLSLWMVALLLLLKTGRLSSRMAWLILKSDRLVLARMGRWFFTPWVFVTPTWKGCVSEDQREEGALSVPCGIWVLGLWFLWVWLGFIPVTLCALCGFQIWGFGFEGFWLLRVVGFLSFVGLFRFSFSI